MYTLKWYKVLKTSLVKSVDDAKREGMINSTWTDLERFHRAES